MLWVITITLDDLFLFFYFYFFCFLGPHLQHMEVPMLGVEWKLQPSANTTASAMPDLSSVCDLYHSLWQGWILNPLIRARDQTSWILVGFVSAEPQGELLFILTFYYFILFYFILFYFILFYFILSFVFLGPYLQRMEVPRLGVESELHLPAYATAMATQDLSRVCDLHHSSRQCRIIKSEARD